MKRAGAALIALAIAITACTSGEPDTATSGEDEATPTSRPEGEAAPIAIVNDDGAIAIIPRPGDEPEVVSPLPASESAYSQPTWSPDGRLLAFVEVVGSPTGRSFAADEFVRTSFQVQALVASVVIYDTADSATRTLAVPFVPFYLYWSPDGQTLSLLGNSPPRIGFGVLDVATGAFSEIDNEQPYFYAWSPDSTRVLAHAFDRLYFMDQRGEQTPLPLSAGSFSAPQWQGNRLMLVIEESGAQSIVLTDTEGAVQERLASIATAAAAVLNPDGGRVAFIDIKVGSSPLDLGSLRIAGPEGIVDVAAAASAFFWSPDGARLLYLTGGDEGGRLAARWNVWEAGTTITFDPFIPSTELFTQYLPFFSQYANSHTFLSPNGQSFVYAGEDLSRGSGVWIQDIAGGLPPRLLAAGSFGAWAPAGP
jgi:TolB protein